LILKGSQGIALLLISAKKLKEVVEFLRAILFKDMGENY